MRYLSQTQKLNLLLGSIYGLFFQSLGYGMKELAPKKTALYYGGYASLVMGYVIFAWGCWHLVEAKKLPRWLAVVGLFSLPGFIVLWVWPATKQATSPQPDHA